ncbi:MAG: formylglycine-generating enzyme family protein [Planctomycetota bacterium]
MLEENERLADLVTLGDLRTQAAALWPRRPEKASAMRHWLGQARGLVDRLPDHEAALQRIRQEAFLSQVVGGVIEESDSSEIVWEKLDAKLRWRLENFSRLIEDLRGMKDLIGDVAARLEVAETIKQRTVDEHAEEWEDAIADIAESDTYGGPELEPQVGLVPLEPDPDSELWEFWVWETGERPERDDETGRWITAAETGMVLVLLRGGTFWMGAQKDNPNEPNYEAEAMDDESPVHQVALRPFLLSKYEMTQAQWQRVIGSNPSYYDEGDSGGPTHPVENVDWSMCTDTCGRIGLILPTEAQWEYACRAGTDTVWWTGGDSRTLEGAANLFDRESLVRNPEISAWGTPMPWVDPYTGHAPVGSFRPNGFGFHDTCGNVWEWCLDWYGPYRLRHRENDGLLQVPEDAECPRANRGGSFDYVASLARSADRNYCTPDFNSRNVGCRPAARVITE